MSTRAFVGAVVCASVVLVAAFAGEAATRTDADVARSDVNVYQGYAARVVGGELPYRDFAIEYPPGALPMFLLPAVTTSTSGASWAPLNAPARRYARAFEVLVLVLSIATIALSGSSLLALKRPAGPVVMALALLALSPLLLGDVFPARYDILPAALTAAAVALALRGHHAVGGALLGFGAAAKLYPVLLVPSLAIVAARQRGARAAIWCVISAAAGAAAVFAPFAIMSWRGTWGAVRVQFQGGLQIESVVSSLLVAASHLGRALRALGLPPPAPLTNRATEAGLSRSILVGAGLDQTALLMTALFACTLVWLWYRLSRSRADPREDLVHAAASTLAVVLVLGTVLSPQYLIWLLPLVALVGGKRGALATTTFAVAALLTRFWFPSGYIDFENGLDGDAGALLLARNLALVVTALVLVLPSGHSSWSRSQRS